MERGLPTRGRARASGAGGHGSRRGTSPRGAACRCRMRDEPERFERPARREAADWNARRQAARPGCAGGAREAYASTTRAAEVALGRAIAGRAGQRCDQDDTRWVPARRRPGRPPAGRWTVVLGARVQVVVRRHRAGQVGDRVHRRRDLRPAQHQRQAQHPRERVPRDPAAKGLQRHGRNGRGDLAKRASLTHRAPAATGIQASKSRVCRVAGGWLAALWRPLA